MQNRSLIYPDSDIDDLPLNHILYLFGFCLGPCQIYMMLYYVVWEDPGATRDAPRTELVRLQVRICDVLVNNGEGNQPGLCQAGSPVVLCGHRVLDMILHDPSVEGHFVRH